MSKSLVIVESPTKAKTITQFLGKNYEVRASYGHVRDLPSSAADIPAALKKERWTRLGVNIEDKFEPLYIIPEEKQKNIKELKSLLKNADQVYLATDEDREGESISWHLLEVLKPKVPVKRLVFHEITKEAIQRALDNPRSIDENLVRAQETRRIVDRLYGYLVSPVLWKKMAPGLSAGRVQSVAMKLLVDRERLRMSFRSASYWGVKAKFAKNGQEFDAELILLSGKRLAIGKDFDPDTGKLHSNSDVELLDQKAAEGYLASIKGHDAKVRSVEEKPYISKPSPPFVTSSLQQEASRKLGFPVKRTMSVAQMLYENGFITYMRTDSTTLSEEGLKGARKLIVENFGVEYLSESVRDYKTKVKNAQEAHEAIRPAGSDFVSPDQVKARLGFDAFRLYEMIWKRTLACQMKDARGMRISVQIDLGQGVFRAGGKTVEFAGFLRAYVEGSDDPEADLAEQERILPAMKQGDKVDPKQLLPVAHDTQPPARYTEGSLIKELERLGIGRPSTWATVVDVVLNRKYAFKRGTALVPSFTAWAVTNLMERYFSKLLDFEFTARLEDDLDSISRGEAESLEYLENFYHGKNSKDKQGLKTLVESGEEKIDPREVCGLDLGSTKSGKALQVRIGRYGPFITDGETRSSVPDSMAPDELNLDLAERLLIEAAKGPAALGIDPASGLSVYLKKGRFGPYIQLGESPPVQPKAPKVPKAKKAKAKATKAKKGKKDTLQSASQSAVVDGSVTEAPVEAAVAVTPEIVKPKLTSLLPGMKPEDVTLQDALHLLAFPKSIGINPENNEQIVIFNGRYGPYVKCGTESRSIPLDQYSPFDISIAQALEVLKLPRGRRASQSKPKKLREIGPHPISNAQIVIMEGRYGPYVSDGTTNASLPRGASAESLTIEEATSLLETRAQSDGAKKKKKGAKRKKTAKSE